jgi:rhodanese-related sulfurtransferase
VADDFQSHGFTNVKALEGGVNAWKDAGFAAEPAMS